MVKGKIVSDLSLAFLIVWLLVTALGLGRAQASGGSWPMFQHDPQHSGESPDAELRVPLVQRWAFAAGALIPSAPAISNGTVFVGSYDGRFHALDALTGAPRWPSPFAVGIATSFTAAAVGDGVVYTVSGGAAGLDAFLHALDVATGTELWKVPLGPGTGSVQSPPVLFAGVVYVGSGGSVSGSCPPGGHKVYAIDAATGAVLPGWPVPIADPNECRKDVMSSPAVTENAVIVGTLGSCFVCPTIFAFDRVRGSPKWSAIVQAPYIFPAPSVSNGLVYVRSGGAGHGGELIAFDEESGAVVWRQGVGGAFGEGSPGIGNGTVYTAGGFQILAFDAATGTPKWTAPALAAGSCAFAAFVRYPFLAVTSDLVFVKSGNECHTAKVYALSAIDGRLLWDSELLSTSVNGVPTGVDSSTPAIADGHLYVGVGRTLYAFRASTPPALVLEISSLDFGPVQVGGTREMVVQARNGGEATLSGSVATDSPFGVRGVNEFIAEGGQSGAVRMTFSPTAAGSVTRSVTITSNGGTATIVVRGIGISVPDLAIANLSTPTAAAPGAQLGFSAIVENRGTGIARSSRLRLYLSPDVEVTPADVVLGDRPVRVLGSGGFVAVNGALRLPRSLAPGTYYLRAVAEIGSGVPDANAANNVATSGAIAVRVGQGARQPWIVNVSPRTASPGTRVAISGTGFGASAGLLRVGSEAATVTSWADERIQAIVPALEADVYDIRVTTIGGTSNGVALTIPGPRIVREIDPRRSILLTVSAQAPSSACPKATHVLADLRLQSVDRTWWVVYREGNARASDTEIPFVFLLSPDGVRTFSRICVGRGEELRFRAAKSGSEGDVDNLALGALSVDMLLRGLFGKVLRPTIFDGGFLDLLKHYSLLHLDGVLTNVMRAVTLKPRATVVATLAAAAAGLKLNDPRTQQLINEVHGDVQGVVKWADRIVGNVVVLVSVPARRSLVWDLKDATRTAPDGGFAGIRVQ